MVNENFTYFELTARDECLHKLAVMCFCWFGCAFFNIFHIYMEDWSLSLLLVNVLLRS